VDALQVFETCNDENHTGEHQNHTGEPQNYTGEHQNYTGELQNHTGEPKNSVARSGCGGVEIFNLSTGRGYSVLDIVRTFERVNRIKIPYVIGPRRLGDIATSYLSPARANEMLGWKAALNIEDMCRDSWNWQKNNPDGY
jgi:hypothetical protein